MAPHAILTAFFNTKSQTSKKNMTTNKQTQQFEPAWRKYEDEFPEMLKREHLYLLMRKRMGISRKKAMQYVKRHFRLRVALVDDAGRVSAQDVFISFDEANETIDKIINSAIVIKQPEVRL
jgi:hypothetical protein